MGNTLEESQSMEHLAVQEVIGVPRKGRIETSSPVGTIEGSVLNRFA
jgi:hypothetical protein